MRFDGERGELFDRFKGQVRGSSKVFCAGLGEIYALSNNNQAGPNESVLAR